MKKTNSKTKSPAPATTAPATTAPKAAKKKSTTAKATPAAVSLTSAPAASPVPPVVPAKTTASVPTIKTVAEASAVKPAGVAEQVKAVAAAKVQTKIIAQIDIGFGNALYVRGDGPGLSWEQGVPMECVGADQWELTLGESSRPISFKVLINDATWCTGPDSVVASGSTATITPDFC